MAAADLSDRLRAAVEAPFRLRHDRGPGGCGVAVSGGGDSMALLDAARLWVAGYGGMTLHAATVDHGLRPGADAEARLVAAWCADRGIPHETLRVDLADGPDLPARARTARYDALRAWAGRVRCGTVLLGHTADDVAETLLMRLERGVGVDGLARMPEWWRDGAGREWARPLLAFTRAELRGHLEARGIPWAEDPSNDDPRFERARVRRRIAEAGLSVPALARSAEALAEAAQSLDARVHALAADVAGEAGDLLLPQPLVSTLRFEEPEALRRLLAGALRWIGGARPRGAELARLARSLMASTEHRWTLAGCLVTRSPAGRPPQTWRIAREPAACPPPVPLDEAWDGRWRVYPPEGWRAEHDAGAHTVGALGDDLPPGHRVPGRPRETLLASPAVRDAGGALVAAPVAGIGAGWAWDLRPGFRDTLRPRRPVFR